MGLCMSMKQSLADRRLARNQREYEQLAKKARSKRDLTLAAQYEKKMLVIFNQRVSLAEYEAAHKAMIYAALGETAKSERYEANVQRIRSSYQTGVDCTDVNLLLSPVPNLTAPSTYVSPLNQSPSLSQSPKSPVSIQFSEPERPSVEVNYPEHERPPAYSPHANMSNVRQPSAPIQESYESPSKQYHSPPTQQSFEPPTQNGPTQSLASPLSNRPIVSAPSPMPLQYSSSYGAEGPTVMLSPASPTNKSPYAMREIKPQTEVKQKNSFISNSSAPLVPKKPLVLMS